MPRMHTHAPTHVITDVNIDKDLEVSWVRRGSNPLSTVILKKSADQPQLETISMALKSVALAALMASTAGVALAKSFTKDEELDAFLAKSDDEQSTELLSFAKAKGMSENDCKPFGDKPMKKDGEDTQAGVDKSDTLSGGAADDTVAAAVAKALAADPAFAALKQENAELKKSIETLSESTTTASLQKQAVTIYKGLGLEEGKTVSLLKSVAKIEDAEVRGQLENILKAHAEMASKIAPSMGVSELMKDGASASSQLRKKAEDVAKSDNISLEEALVKVSEDPANGELIAKVDAETEDQRG